MTTSTKIFLAIFAALVVVLVVYYSRVSEGDGTDAALDASVRNPDSVAIETHGSTRDASRDQSRDLAGDRQQNDDVIPLDWSDERRNASRSGRRGTSSGRSPLGGLIAPPPTIEDTNRGPTRTVLNKPINVVGVDEPRSSGVRPLTDDPSRPISTPPPSPKFREYVVDDGDTMTDIALSMLGSAQRWSEIAQANPLVDPNRLRVGQKLRIPIDPDAPKETAPKPQPKPDSPDVGPVTYFVQSGDTLSRIADVMLGDRARWRDIFEANRDVLNDPDDLQVGMSLQMPR
ncbi:MAG: LysM peptidoglycan-binding domain-containing protein [Planctomycetota bacterium]